MSGTFAACGIDIGGTFTDCVLLETTGDVHSGKAPTTPDNLTDGFFGSLSIAAQAAGATLEEALRDLLHLGHGSTVATNIMVQRTGAKVALLTTSGHGDATLIQRASGRVAGLPPSQLLDLRVGIKPPPLAPRNLIREINERVDLDGDVIVPLDEVGATRDIQELLSAGVDAVAVCLLWSFRNPKHEQALVKMIGDCVAARNEESSSVFVSASHEVSPTWGEYERAMTTIINAYIGPRTGKYIANLASELEARRFRGSFSIMKSDGGGGTLSDAARFPVTLIASGPAGGLAATQQLAQQIGAQNAIATDMGGTSFDIGLVIDGAPVSATAATVNRYAFHLPTLDIRSVGSGGGSIAWVDDSSGALRVGPRSAGSVPGPASYDRGGTEATVTDADVVLGYVNPDYFLGGRLKLNAQLAEEAVARLGAQLDLSALETAAGIRRIVDAQMSDAIRMLTIERGHDPRDFILFSYGGAGPVHGADYARELGVETVVVPLADVSSLWSAYGIANADLVHVREHSEVIAEPFESEPVRIAIEALGKTVTELFEAEQRKSVELEFVASLKYQLQAHVVQVPVVPDDAHDLEAVVVRFEDMYRDLYGADSGFRAAGIEITGFTCNGRLPRELSGTRTREQPVRDLAQHHSRPIHWVDEDQTIDTPVYRASDVVNAAAITGPAILELSDTTVVVPSDFSISGDSFGNLLLKALRQ